MALIVNNIISSSSSIEYKYITEEENFGYTISASYLVDISDVEFTDNEATLLLGIQALRAAMSQKFIVARLGGDDYEHGIVESISFDESPLVGSLTATININEDKRLESYAGSTFASIIPNPNLVESFTEDYDFSREEDNYSYTRNVSIQYKKDVGGFFIDNTKAFFSNYLNVRPNFGYQNDGISENARFDKGFKGLLSEEIDLINLSASFTESFDSSEIDEPNQVSKLKTVEIRKTEEGYLEKSYNITFKSLSRQNNSILQNAVKTEVDSIVSTEGRVASSTTKGFSVDGSSASLSIEFSDNPSDSQQSKIFSCSEDFQNDESVYTSNVTYQDDGANNQQKYQNSITSWSADSGSGLSYINRLFNDVPTVYEISRSVTFNKTEGSVTETTQFTTKESLDTTNLPAGITKYELSATTNNVYRGVNDYRHKVEFDLSDKINFYVSNDLNKLTAVSATLNITFTQDIKDTILNYLRDKSDTEGIAGDILGKAQEVSGNLTNYSIQSDRITVNLNGGSASRTITYNAY
jgi:hypothetical protein